MDKMRRLSEAIRTLIDEQFSGYIKINFTQGSIGRVEKSEDLEESLIISKGGDISHEETVSGERCR
jgi:hypothetical protein